MRQCFAVVIYSMRLIREYIFGRAGPRRAKWVASPTPSVGWRGGSKGGAEDAHAPSFAGSPSRRRARGRRSAK
jgi:hypothetical protein